jgi:hypothetical protein
MTTCLKIEMAWALYKAIDALCLKKAHEIIKGGPYVPFVDHTMLAHQWKKTAFCWWKQSKTSMWGEQMHLQGANHSKVFPLPKSPMLRPPHETLWTNNIMSTHWKVGDKSTWVWSRETWNPKSLTMKVKTSQQHHGMQSVPHHGLSERSGSLLVTKVDHKCNESN